VKDRCHSHNGRCLRFWQFKAQGGETPLNRLESARLLGGRDVAELLKPLSEGTALTEV